MIDTTSAILITLSSIGFLAAVYFAYHLAQETHAGRYWVAFVIAGLGLGAHQWMKLIHIIYPIDHELQTICIELGILIGAVFLAYGAYGLQQSVKDIKSQAGG